MGDAVDAVLVEREETPVMFLRAEDPPAGIGPAWERLESTLGSLHGRRFFGVMDVVAREYRACVQLEEADDPPALGLETGVLPGGPYLRARLHGEPPAVYEEIAPTFERLATMARPDPRRPSIEFYRRRDEIDLLLPVGP